MVEVSSEVDDVCEVEVVAPEVDEVGEEDS